MVADNDRRIVTPEFRLGFPKVLKPESFQGGRNEYSLRMCFEKGTDLTSLIVGAKASIEWKWPDPNARPANLHNPFRKADTFKKGMYPEDSIIVKAASDAEKPAPELVDDKRRDLRTLPLGDVQRILYPGCYCKAVVLPVAFDRQAKKGVTFVLITLKKIRDGEAFGSGTSTGLDLLGGEDLGEAVGGSNVDDFLR